MPWTTLILVTVLFSVICGNRLMDNRLLRYSSAAGPFKSANENSAFMETLSKFKTDLKSQADGTFLDTSPGTDDDELNYHHEMRNRNCNNNNFADFMKNGRHSANSDEEEKINVDTLPGFNDLQMYGNSKTIESIYDGDALVGGINDMNLLNSMLATLPVSNYKDFYTDLVLDSAVSKELGIKRNGNSIGSAPARGCDCKVKNDLVDLGQQHFPRYLLNAVCHAHDGRNSDLPPKCWSGSLCRPLEYKVKVLTFRTLMDTMQKDPTLAWLPDDLRPIWKFKTITVTAGCFCS